MISLPFSVKVLNARSEWKLQRRSILLLFRQVCIAMIASIVSSCPLLCRWHNGLGWKLEENKEALREKWMNDNNDEPDTSHPIKAVRLPRHILRSPPELLSRSAISIPQPHRDKDTLGPSGGTTSLNCKPNKDCPWLLLPRFLLETIDPWVTNEKPGARKNRTNRCHPHCFTLLIRTLLQSRI
jgi:uncharacterized protein YodC (DUF2158 family)